MQAILLAAGKGTRLGALTHDTPKALVPVNGMPILDRALARLAAAGITECIVGVGYLADRITTRFGDGMDGLRLRYVPSPDFATTNNITTMYRCGALVTGDVVTLEGDILFQPLLLERLLAAGSGNHAVVSPAAPHMDGTMVTLDADGVIEAFIPKAEQSGAGARYFKTVNVYRFDGAFFRDAYLPALAAHMDRHGTHQYYEDVLGAMVARGEARVSGTVVDAAQWAEVDTADDLARAEAMDFAE